MAKTYKEEKHTKKGGEKSSKYHKDKEMCKCKHKKGKCGE